MKKIEIKKNKNVKNRKEVKENDKKFKWEFKKIQKK